MAAKNFNKLSPAELERLALLSEELGEAQQAIGKILRHGYERFHPHSPHVSNREALERELGDVCVAIDLLMTNKDVDSARIDGHMATKINTVRRYLHHQNEKRKKR